MTVQIIDMLGTGEKARRQPGVWVAMKPLAELSASV
jgi:hypothetical protein